MQLRTCSYSCYKYHVRNDTYTCGKQVKWVEQKRCNKLHIIVPCLPLHYCPTTCLPATCAFPNCAALSNLKFASQQMTAGLNISMHPQMHYNELDNLAQPEHPQPCTTSIPNNVHAGTDMLLPNMTSAVQPEPTQVSSNPQTCSQYQSWAYMHAHTTLTMPMRLIVCAQKSTHTPALKSK